MKSLILILLITLKTALLAQNQVATSNEYICPPCNNACDEETYERPGACEHCNMVLIKKNLSKSIAFYLQDGVEVLDFAGPMEVFVYAGYEVFTVSADESPIHSQGILKVTPDYTIDNAPKADILAFFGGNSRAAFENKRVIKWVKNQSNVDHYFSVCTGAFVLAEAGLLEGKTATTFHDALDGLESYKNVDVRRDVRFVDNGNIVTTAGVSAGIDGALHMVAKLQGLNAAKRVAYYMEYDNWNPGDGLILTSDDPYKTTAATVALKNYIGKYEYKDGRVFELVINEETKELNALIEKNVYPIYNENGDLFSDSRNEPVYFKRNNANEVIGYTLTPNGELYKKLD